MWETLGCTLVGLCKQLIRKMLSPGDTYCFDGRDEVQSFLSCVLLKEPESLLIQHKADACYLK